jgi:hypothetical protein
MTTTMTTRNSLKDCHTYERHAHKCEDCGHVWYHDYSLAFESYHDMDKYLSEIKRYARAHDCPNCGSSQYRTHDGDEPIEFYHDGDVTRKLEQGETVKPEKPSKVVIEYRKMLRTLSDVVEKG